ncbi:VOC family protein [Mucilaginibacter sp. HMF5004]|uniref:VOC family protein n=1 Tax=Mucilaginibacter rivuli TaxID=2857527 RepID=UPI001C5E776C|nr:VOC family protein [Mucilaginibacter rivuli]MBW4888273.1 VOC family protein [Mucilaginibacter rivuli]
MKTKTAFAPMLAIGKNIHEAGFYTRAFGAVEDWCIRNDDGSIHVAQFNIDGATFHIHEVMPNSGDILPADHNSVTIVIGLMTDDVHALFNQAVAAGATIITPVTDHDYGWRQGELEDVFGHRWVIQKVM